MLITILIVATAIALLVAAATLRRRSHRLQGRGEPAWRDDALVSTHARDDRPADGIVDRARMIGVSSVETPEAPGFSRFDTWTGTTRSGPRRPGNLGRSFPLLLGRVALVSMFLGRDGTPWSGREIAGALRALERAGRWIEREAIRWAVSVNLELVDVYFEATPEEEEREVAVFQHDDWGSIIPIDDGPMLRTIGRATAMLGFRDLPALIGTIGEGIEADQVVWLIHVRRAGRSFALPSDATGIPGVAVAICYVREEPSEGPLAKPPFVDPLTIVHEALHLFGALDKYEGSLGRFEAGTVTERDIMVLDAENLSRNRVDPLTAFEIGWSASTALRPSGPDVPLRSLGPVGNATRPAPSASTLKGTGRENRDSGCG